MSSTPGAPMSIQDAAGVWWGQAPTQDGKGWYLVCAFPSGHRLTVDGWDWMAQIDKVTNALMRPRPTPSGALPYQQLMRNVLNKKVGTDKSGAPQQSRGRCW